MDLSGYVLQDDNGPTNGMSFPEGTILNIGDYLLLCREQHFSFGIGKEDPAALLDPLEKFIFT